MKCLVSFACLLAVASAVYAQIGLTSEARQFDPVAIAAGAPLPTGDTYEVAAAKAAHLQAHAAARGSAYGAPIAPATAYSGYSHPAVAPVSYPGYAAPVAYSGYAAPHASQARQVDPVAIAAGAPLPTGDTAEVAAAKAAHLQAHAAAKGVAYSAPIAHGFAHAGYSGYSAPHAPQARQFDPVAIAAGAPLPTGDTAEVAAAKAAHLQAHAAAKAGHYLHKRSPGYLHSAIAAPLAYAAPVHSYGYSSYASPLAYGYPYYAHY